MDQMLHAACKFGILETKKLSLGVTLSMSPGFTKYYTYTYNCEVTQAYEITLN